MTHSNCSLSFAFAYLYLERLSEEQHRNTCREAHEQDRGQEAGEHRLLALGSDGLEVHVDAERGHGHAEHDVRKVHELRWR